MKIKALFYLFLFAGLIISCSEDDFDGDKGPEDTYFTAGVNGPSWNGVFRIEGDEMSMVANAFVSPSGDPLVPDILFMTFNDQNQNFGVSIQVPAEKRSTELTDNNPNFGFSLTNTTDPNDGILLISKTLSFTISDIVLNTDFLGFTIPERVIANFTGVCIYENWDSGMMVEESHTVQGNFEYYFFQ